MADVYTTSATPSYGSFLTKFIVTSLLDTVHRAQLPWLLPGSVRFDTYRQGHTDDYVFGGLGDLPYVWTPTPDETSSPAIEAIQSYILEFATVEAHRAVGYTSTAERKMPFNIGAELAERVARAVAVAFDQRAYAVYVAGAASLPQVGVGTAELTRDIVTKAVSTARGLDLKPLPSGKFGLIVHPWAVNSLLLETGEKAVSQMLIQQDEEGYRSGSVGDIGGATIFTSTSIPNTAGAAKGVLVGADALAFADLSSIQTAHIPPTPSIADPTGRRGVVSYVIRCGGALIGRKVKHDDAAVRYNALILNHKVVDPAL